MTTSTMKLKLYIWENEDITDSYNGDGTLVVLAESPEQARDMIRRDAAEMRKLQQEWYAERDEYIASLGGIDAAPGWFREGKGAEIWERAPSHGKDYSVLSIPDDEHAAVINGGTRPLDRPPDRTIDLTPLTSPTEGTVEPQVVAFNGGGYD